MFLKLNGISNLTIWISSLAIRLSIWSSNNSHDFLCQTIKRLIIGFYKIHVVNKIHYVVVTYI